MVYSSLWLFLALWFCIMVLNIWLSCFYVFSLPVSALRTCLDQTQVRDCLFVQKIYDVQDEIINANLGWCSWKAIYSPFHHNCIVLSFHFYTENINILWILKIRKNYKTPLQSKAMKYCSRGNLQFNLHQVSNRLLREFKNFEFTQKFVSLRPGADPLKRKKSCLTTWGPFYKS